MSRKIRTQKTIELIINLAIITLLSVIFTVIWGKYYSEYVIFFKNGYILIAFLYGFLLGLFMVIYRATNIGTTKLSEIIYSQSLSVFFTNIITYFQLSLLIKSFYSINGFILIFFVQVISCLICTYVAFKIYHVIMPPLNTLLVYGDDYNEIYSKINKFQADNFKINKVLKYDNTVNLENEIIKYEAVMLNGLSIEDKEKITLLCYRYMIVIFDVPSLFEVITKNSQNMHMIDTPFLILNKFGPSQLDKIIKRTIDIVASLLAIIISSPFWLLVIIAIKLEDNGPVFYKQVRLTQYGRKFNIVKFRSMKVDAEKNSGAVLAKENDDRITKVGRFIRKVRLDELPQLLNILKGDMTIVGPRPERPELMEKIVKELPEFPLRLTVKAGLTGYAQIYGKYNTTSRDKLLMDLMYIENCSTLIDIKLMLMTIKILFMKESTEGIK
ncbi:MAG: exopolysaccharide biosynthesis polyprenyl glycosylphosphotransferase [Erysipelotrichaceae bacterium]|nr:exopolysaccharide biosynthesis polyprenyl glycosylphosphotransferase [Erysipelotrichaceae bacterium]